ncbi:unnamed protein product [Cylindrotheca closterium]|uniref:Uncharacterized protein n=1 Tax=Cylindrotheca closterium TaxID=2856 RepID=A0AAD2FXF1_9STRA|nr:unnamed protein product [Cylindrotheca closterium]
MPRETNKRRSIAGSVRSGRSSISTLTQMENSCSSTISAITMDDELAFCHAADRSASRKSFGPKLRSMPEQQRASDPDMEEVQQYLDTLRIASNDDSNNRFSSSAQDGVCECPRRKSSSSYLDYQSAHQYSVNSSYQVVVNKKSNTSGNPLQGEIESYDTFYTGLEEEDEALPMSYAPSRRSQRSSAMKSRGSYGTGMSSISFDLDDDQALPLSYPKISQRISSTLKSRGSYGTGMSSISLDLDDVFGESSNTPNIFSERSSPSVDVSPQMVRRRSSLSYVSSADKSAAARLLSAVNLMAVDNDDDDSELVVFPEDSGDICLAGSTDRFETRCPREKSSSITKPARRGSAYKLDLRPAAYASCRQG